MHLQKELQLEEVYYNGGIFKNTKLSFILRIFFM